MTLISFLTQQSVMISSVSAAARRSGAKHILQTDRVKNIHSDLEVYCFFFFNVTV